MNNIENAEYGIDSRYKSVKDQESDSQVFIQARVDRKKNLTKEQILRARLMQLKLKIDEQLNEPGIDNHNYFIEFLETYIDTIYSKRVEFAEDIGITPVLLSQVINKHREPKNEFILKLVVHSEIAYKDICDFDKNTWLHLYFNEKIRETMSTQENWRPEIENQIKFRELIAS